MVETENGRNDVPENSQNDGEQKAGEQNAEEHKAGEHKDNVEGQAESAPAKRSASTRKKAKAEASPILADSTYSGLQEENRVVMRHQIALNLETFRAATDNFDPRPVRDYAPLQAANPPFFSVILPNYNGMAHLPTVMAALADQTFGDFEVIVVDDASTDRSLVWLEEHYPRARLVVNRRNLGFAASCNVGAGAAMGRFVVLLNTDTEPEPGWLAALAQAICRHPEAGIFSSKLLLFDRRDTIHSAGDGLGKDGIPRNRGVWQKDDGRFDREEEVFSACGGAAAIRREVWERLGGFDEDFWMYLEDIDFAVRSRLLGQKVIYVPQARVYHRLSATGGGEMASYYVGRNTLWFLLKNLPVGLWLRFGPNIAAAQAREALAALRAYRGREARARLRGMLAGLAGAPAMLAKRRAVQAQRRIADEELVRLFDD